MGFFSDQNGEVLLDELGEPMTDEETGVNLWVNPIMVAPVFSEAITNNTPIAIIAIDDMIIIADFSEPVITSTVPVDLTIDNLLITPVFSEAIINDSLPVELTIQNLLITPTFSGATSRRITGLITINITTEI